MVILLD